MYLQFGATNMLSQLATAASGLFWVKIFMKALLVIHIISSDSTRKKAIS